MKVMRNIHAFLRKTLSGIFIGNVQLNIPYYHVAVDDETDTKSCNYPIQNEQDFRV